MKITNKIRILFLTVLLPVALAGCSDDDKPEGGTPDFVLEQESVRVQTGAENKATINIKQGGGEYSVFSLDKNLVKAEIENGVLTMEGLANGQTSLIVSDKYSRYRRLQVSSYTVDVVELSHKAFESKTRLGNSETLKATVVSGNGGYKAKSNHPSVSVSVTGEGDIEMNVTSKKADYTATVTVTDCTGLSTDIAVSVKASLVPFTDSELEAIMEDSTRNYNYDGSYMYYSYFSALNETLDGGKQRYGWEYYGMYWLYLDFTGDKSVGVKNNAHFLLESWNSKVDTPVTLEIIKNDGTNIWGIFFHVNDDEERLYSGYFCDTVNP